MNRSKITCNSKWIFEADDGFQTVRAIDNRGIVDSREVLKVPYFIFDGYDGLWNMDRYEQDYSGVTGGRREGLFWGKQAQVCELGAGLSQLYHFTLTPESRRQGICGYQFQNVWYNVTAMRYLPSAFANALAIMLLIRYKRVEWTTVTHIMLSIVFHHLLDLRLVLAGLYIRQGKGRDLPSVIPLHKSISLYVFAFDRKTYHHKCNVLAGSLERYRLSIYRFSGFRSSAPTIRQHVESVVIF